MAKVIFNVDTNEDRCELFCWALEHQQENSYYCTLFEEEIVGRRRCFDCLEAEVIQKGDCWKNKEEEEMKEEE